VNTYHIDTDTGEVEHLTPVPAVAATTDDAYFVDPAALEQPEVRRALGDIYQALRTRRFVNQQPAGTPSAK
jgi:hypothetical protein